MRLTYLGRRHAFTLCTGDDARDDEPTDDGPRDMVTGPLSADLTQSTSTAAAPYTYPEDRTHRTGFTS